VTFNEVPAAGKSRNSKSDLAAGNSIAGGEPKQRFVKHSGKFCLDNCHLAHKK
jgi:hypothetical protein